LKAANDNVNSLHTDTEHLQNVRRKCFLIYFTSFTPLLLSETFAKIIAFALKHFLQFNVFVY